MAIKWTKADIIRAVQQELEDEPDGRNWREDKTPPQREGQNPS